MSTLPRRVELLEAAQAPASCPVCAYPEPPLWHLADLDFEGLDRLIRLALNADWRPPAEEARLDARRRAADRGYCPRCGGCWASWALDPVERDTLADALAEELKVRVAAAAASRGGF